MSEFKTKINLTNKILAKCLRVLLNGVYFVFKLNYFWIESNKEKMILFLLNLRLDNIVFITFIVSKIPKLIY